MAKIKRNIKVKKIVAVALFVATLVLLVGGISSFAALDYDTVSASVFSRGALNENGEHIPSESALVTKEAIACRGLKVVPDFDAHLTYDVYYYDSNDNLVERKLGFNKTYDEDYPLHIATTCRIVLHPTFDDDEDEKISFLEVYSIARKVDITVSKDQRYRYANCSNLYYEPDAVKGKIICNNEGVVNTIELFDGEIAKDAKASNIIPVNGDYEYYDIYVLAKEPISNWLNVAISDAEGNCLAKEYASLYGMNEGEWAMITIKVPNDDSAHHLRLSCPVNCEVYVFGYND